MYVCKSEDILHELFFTFQLWILGLNSGRQAQKQAPLIVVLCYWAVNNSY